MPVKACFTHNTQITVDIKNIKYEKDRTIPTPLTMWEQTKSYILQNRAQSRHHYRLTKWTYYTMLSLCLTLSLSLYESISLFLFPPISPSLYLSVSPFLCPSFILLHSPVSLYSICNLSLYVFLPLFFSLSSALTPHHTLSDIIHFTILQNQNAYYSQRQQIVCNLLIFIFIEHAK